MSKGDAIVAGQEEGRPSEDVPAEVADPSPRTSAVMLLQEFHVAAMLFGIL